MPETRRLRYVGPFSRVFIPRLNVHVERNHHLLVEDAALATSLLEQRDNWREVGTSKSQDEDAPVEQESE